MHFPIYAPTETLISLVKFYNLKITQSSIKKSVSLHQDSTSLLCLSDMLSKLNIENTSLTIQPEQLALIEEPFIAHTFFDGGSFLFISEITETHITYITSPGKSKQLPIELFKQYWSGIIMLFEIENYIEEEDYTAKKREEFFIKTQPYLLLIALSLLLAILIIRNFKDWLWLLYLLLQLTGLITSTILVIRQYDKGSKWINNLCSLSGTNHCSSILDSKAAHINSWLSWSDVGFLYFLTSTLIALVGEYNIIKSLALINLIAVFYSIYSIYYQAVIAQQWCLLCCIVQATVVLSAFIPFHWINDLNFTYSTIALLLILSIVSISIMRILIKPLLKNFYEHSRVLLAYEKLKANSTVIKALFSEQKIIDSTLNVTSLDLGNSNATNEIIIVTNLFCEPCALLHEKVEKWLKTYKELSIKLIFISYARNDKKRIRVIQSLFALDQSTKEMALSEWFKNGKHHPDKWLEKYGIKEITSYHSDIILQQQYWCQQMKIESTPTLFINGKQMPRMYTFDDAPLLTLAIS